MQKTNSNGYESPQCRCCCFHSQAMLNDPSPSTSQRFPHIYHILHPIFVTPYPTKISESLPMIILLMMHLHRFLLKVFPSKNSSRTNAFRLPSWMMSVLPQGLLVLLQALLVLMPSALPVLVPLVHPRSLVSVQLVLQVPEWLVAPEKPLLLQSQALMEVSLNLTRSAKKSRRSQESLKKCFLQDYLLVKNWICLMFIVPKLWPLQKFPLCFLWACRAFGR